MSKKKNMYKLESLARLISGRTPEREQKEYYAETGTPWSRLKSGSGLYPGDSGIPVRTGKRKG